MGFDETGKSSLGSVRNYSGGNALLQTFGLETKRIHNYVLAQGRTAFGGSAGVA